MKSSAGTKEVNPQAKKSAGAKTARGAKPSKDLQKSQESMETKNVSQDGKCKAIEREPFAYHDFIFPL